MVAVGTWIFGVLKLISQVWKAESKKNVCMQSFSVKKNIRDRERNDYLQNTPLGSATVRQIQGLF